jgi:large subunit ribosomal protein L10
VERALKYSLVEELKSHFASSEVVFVIYNRGMTVDDSRALRRKMKGVGNVKVAKNKLVKIALSGSKHEGLLQLMSGPTAIIYSNDPVGISKVLADFTKGSEKVEIGGGVMSGMFLAPAQIEQLAKLPSLDELRGKIIGLLQAPASKIVGVLQAPGLQLARVVDAYAKK